MRLGAIALAGVVLLSACGGGKKSIDNKQLAADVLQKLGSSSTALVCWTHQGYLGGAFHHAYNRACGPQQGVSSIYITMDAKNASWCVVTPRYAKLPLCPGVAGG